MAEPLPSVAVYAVGALSDLRAIAALGRRVRRANRRNAWILISAHLRRFPRHWRSRSYWNGYLAEPSWPGGPGSWTRCGHAWTRRRALRDLAEHVLAEQIRARRALAEVETDRA